MKTLPNGFFSLNYDTGDLAKGLRATDKLPRNNKFLTKCSGMVGKEGTLSKLASLTVSSIVTADVELDNFPFPQIFITDKHIIVCNETSILELVGATLVVQIDDLTPGNMWSLAGSHNFVYLSNGKVSVVRDPITQVYSVSATAPKSTSICNFNGQMLVGYLPA